MTARIGHNTVKGRRLAEIVEQAEEYDRQKKEIGEAFAALMAAAKAEGFDTRGIRYVIKARRLTVEERQEQEGMRDAYMHAMGMAEEPPLFRLFETMTGDGLTRDAMIEQFKAIAPERGEIILHGGDNPVRIYRTMDGQACVEPYVAARNAPHRPATDAASDDAPDAGPAAGPAAEANVTKNKQRGRRKIPYLSNGTVVEFPRDKQ